MDGPCGSAAEITIGHSVFILQLWPPSSLPRAHPPSSLPKPPFPLLTSPHFFSCYTILPDGSARLQASLFPYTAGGAQMG